VQRVASRVAAMFATRSVPRSGDVIVVTLCLKSDKENMLLDI